MTYRIKPHPRNIPVDEAHLISHMERFWIAAEENRRGILAALGVLLLAAGAVAGAIWYDLRQEEAALTLHEEATRFYSVQPPDKPEQAKKNLEKAISLYRQVVEQFPHSDIAPYALYQLGIALERDNQHALAIEAYEKFAERHGDMEAMLGLVYQRLGYASWVNGDPEKAEQAFASVLSTPGALNKDHALFELGKLEEAQSRPEGALARFQELMDTYPNSPLANEATVLIKALGGKEPSGEKSEDTSTQSPTGEEKPEAQDGGS